MTAIVLYFLAAHGFLDVDLKAPDLLFNGWLLGTSIDAAFIATMFVVRALWLSRTAKGRSRNRYSY